MIGDRDQDGCDQYARNTSWCGQYDTQEFISAEMCCACGGGDREGDISEDPDSGDDIVIEPIDHAQCVPMCNMCTDDDRDCWRVCFECLEEVFGDEDFEPDTPEPEPEPVGLACEEFCNVCEFEDMECWEGCHACLDPHFNEDNEENGQTEEDEEASNFDECDCDFEDDACWEDCYGEEEEEPVYDDSHCECDSQDDACWMDCYGEENQEEENYGADYYGEDYYGED